MCSSMVGSTFVPGFSNLGSIFAGYGSLPASSGAMLSDATSGILGPMPLGLNLDPMGGLDPSGPLLASILSNSIFNDPAVMRFWNWSGAPSVGSNFLGADSGLFTSLSQSASFSPDSNFFVSLAQPLSLPAEVTNYLSRPATVDPASISQIASIVQDIDARVQALLPGAGTQVNVVA